MSFFHQHFGAGAHYTNRRMDADYEQRQAVNDVDAGLVGDLDRRKSDRSSESGLFDIFLAEFGRLKRIAAGMGLGASDIEDVLQEVSIRVMSNAGMKLTAEEALGWLIRVTINQCIVEHRRRKRFGRRAQEILRRRRDLEKGSASPDETAIKVEELETVREILQGLDGSLLSVMVLRYFDGMNSNEIGEVLSLNASTVRSRLREGRMILAKGLIERGIGP